MVKDLAAFISAIFGVGYGHGIWKIGRVYNMRSHVDNIPPVPPEP